MFGLSVLQDVASRQMQNHFYQAIIANKLAPAGTPTFAPGQLAEGKDLEFTATFEVYPEVALTGLSKIEVTKPVVDTTADDMDKILETLRKQHATWSEKTGAAVSGDRVKIAGQLMKDKEMQYNPEVDPNYFSFFIKDSNDEEHKVVLLASKPQDFEMSEQIVLTGSMKGEEFVATELLMKCPSKYKDEEIYIKSEKGDI